MTRPPALILTAGIGTRLRPLTYIRAKAAVPVNGEALARRVARWLATHGFRDQVFNLHHQPATITAILGDGSDLDVRIRYSWEQPVLGSAGGPRHALPLLTDGGQQRILIVNGDTLTDVDLEALLAAHERSGALVTMALIRNPAPEKYGGVAVDRSGFVVGFPRPGTATESYHFIGVQVAEARIFAGLTDGVPFESVTGLYPALMKESPASVGAFVSDAAFRDIGTPADCLATSLALAREEGDRLVSRSARIGGDVVLQDCTVWDDVAIAPHARLRECIVADRARIPAGADYARCAIVPAAGQAPAAGERIDGDLLISPLDRRSASTVP